MFIAYSATLVIHYTNYLLSSSVCVEERRRSSTIGQVDNVALYSVRLVVFHVHSYIYCSAVVNYVYV